MTPCKKIDHLNVVIVIINFFLFLEHIVDYCTTCPWRRCGTYNYLNFGTLCICNKRNHKKKHVKVELLNYSFSCDICTNTHHLLLTRPIQFYCSLQKSTSRRYNHWNRPSIEFCINCLIHQPGRNLGFCWFCNNCQQHQLKYMSGTSII